MADVRDPILLEIVAPTVDLLEEYFTRQQRDCRRSPDELTVVGTLGYRLECAVGDDGLVSFAARFEPDMPGEEILSLVDLCNRWNAAEWIGTASATVGASWQAATTVLRLDYAVPCGVGVNRLQLHEIARAFVTSADSFAGVVQLIRDRIGGAQAAAAALHGAADAEADVEVEDVGDDAAADVDDTYEDAYADADGDDVGAGADAGEVGDGNDDG